MFSDGCPGQIKNITMVGMLAKWLHGESPEEVKSIEFIFPIVGHYFILLDRIFGQIEKELRKVDTIIDPQEYVDIFSKYGNVKILGRDVPVYEFKSVVAVNVKSPPQLHSNYFSLRRAKVLRLNQKD